MYAKEERPLAKRCAAAAENPPPISLMNEVKLPGTVFTAGEPPTLLPNEQQAPQNSNESWRLKSKHHNEIKKLMESRAQSARIFGSSWKDHLGFFMPFGTGEDKAGKKNRFWNIDNSFWARLKMSPTFQHLFAYDKDLVEKISQLGEKSLTTEISGARITVQDVDSAVNNCALICALLLGVPASIIGDMVGNQDGWIDYLNAMKQPDGKLCEPDNQTSSIYSDFCLREFEKHYQGFFVVTTVCFFSALFTLITAVCYYMCRPSESCNNTSMNVLFEACTLEVRAQIRQTRNRHQGEPVDPSIPFDSWGEELEVFSKAKFMAQNEAEEQKNQEFYMWYKSKMLRSTFIVQIARTYYLKR